MQCPNISGGGGRVLLFFFKDGADLRIDSFSGKESLHTLTPGANGFTFFTTSQMIKTMFLFFNFQT